MDPSGVGERAYDQAQLNCVRLDAVEKELKRLSEQADLQTKLLFILASIVRKGLKSGCAEQRALTDQMHALSGGVKEHLRAQAALARDLREMKP